MMPLLPFSFIMGRKESSRYFMGPDANRYQSERLELTSVMTIMLELRLQMFSIFLADSSRFLQHNERMLIVAILSKLGAGGLWVRIFSVV